MVTTSAARIAANRQNAQKSSGPRTSVGKARARANAVKHGLTGAGIALPTEDTAVVERRFLDLQVELAPATLAASLLVRQVALMSVRIDRAALQEAAALAETTRHAAIEFDLARASAIDRLFHTIETNPAENRRRLLTTPEGVTRLIDALDSVRVQLGTGAYKSWNLTVRQKVDAYLGGEWADFPVARSEALLNALRGFFAYIPLAEIAAIPKKAAQIEWARRHLIDLIDAESARLIALRATLDTADDAADRREAAHRVLFDPSPEATLARKYEAAATRAFHRALRDLHDLAALSTPEPEPALDPVPETLINLSREHDPATNPSGRLVPDASALESDAATAEGSPTPAGDGAAAAPERTQPSPLGPVTLSTPAQAESPDRDPHLPHEPKPKLPNEPKPKLPNEPNDPVVPAQRRDLPPARWSSPPDNALDDRSYGIPVYHPPNLGY